MKYATKMAIKGMIKALDRFIDHRGKVHSADEDWFVEQSLEEEVIIWRDVLELRNHLMLLLKGE